MPEDIIVFDAIVKWDFDVNRDPAEAKKTQTSRYVVYLRFVFHTTCRHDETILLYNILFDIVINMLCVRTEIRQKLVNYITKLPVNMDIIRFPVDV